jgi:hypothetical protein
MTHASHLEAAGVGRGSSRNEKQIWRSRPVATTPDQAIDGPIPYFTPPAVKPATMRRWKISTAMRSGTVTITPAAMMVPYGVSKPV